jgi:hypothetical protein
MEEKQAEFGIGDRKEIGEKRKRMDRWECAGKRSVSELG